MNLLLYAGPLESDVMSLDFWYMMPSSSTMVLRNIVGKVSEVMFVCWCAFSGVGEVSESDMRGNGNDFLVSLGIL